MAGINVSDSSVIYFGEAREGSFLLTAANSSQALGATDPGSVKLTPLSEYPKKGRGAMGVRCQRLLKHEDQIYFAALVQDPATAFDSAGQQLELPGIDPRRDASGTPSPGYIEGAF